MLYCVADMPTSPLEASALFHERDLPGIVALLKQDGQDLTLAFTAADHSHRAWRLAVVQGLAREHAPLRINAVASNDQAAIAAAHAWCGNAPGVTGQYWPLDVTGVEGA